MKETIRERREKLTAKVVEARREYHNIYNLVKHEVRKANPNLKETDWVKFYDLIDKDPRVMVANATLLALCEAANIMGAEID